MKDILIQSINLLPSIAMIVLLIYFYSQKRIPGLLLLLITEIVGFFVVAASTFGIQYFSTRYESAAELQSFYRMIGIISILTQLVAVAAMGIILHHYPTSKEKQKIADNF
jgi:hypothetical protein